MKILKDLRLIDWIIIIVAISAYVPLIEAVFAYNGAGQSFASWSMWFALDVISLYLAIKNKKSYAVIIAFMFGGLFITASLLIKHKIDWGYKENIVLIATLFSAITFTYYDVWKHNSYAATIFATIAQIIAGIPLLQETWAHPDPKSSLLPFILLLIANTLTVYSAEKWSVPDRLFSSCFAIYNVLLLIPLIAKLL